MLDKTRFSRRTFIKIHQDSFWNCLRKEENLRFDTTSTLSLLSAGESWFNPDGFRLNVCVWVCVCVSAEVRSCWWNQRMAVNIHISWRSRHFHLLDLRKGTDSSLVRMWTEGVKLKHICFLYFTKQTSAQLVQPVSNSCVFCCLVTLMLAACFSISSSMLECIVMRWSHRFMFPVLDLTQEADPFSLGGAKKKIMLFILETS